MENLRTWAAKQNDPFLQFAANPKFDETFEGDNGKLVLTSYLETYTVSTNPMQHQESMAEYIEFLNWYTQLNTLLTSPIPPEPRLRLNDAIARRKVIPIKVELKRAGEDPVRAEHDFTWRLSQDDRSGSTTCEPRSGPFAKSGNEEFLKRHRRGHREEAGRVYSCVSLWNRFSRSRVIAPGLPVPIARLSTLTTGITSAAVPVRKHSSAM